MGSAIYSSLIVKTNSEVEPCPDFQIFVQVPKNPVPLFVYTGRDKESEPYTEDNICSDSCDSGDIRDSGDSRDSSSMSLEGEDNEEYTVTPSDGEGGHSIVFEYPSVERHHARQFIVYNAVPPTRRNMYEVSITGSLLYITPYPRHLGTFTR